MRAANPLSEFSYIRHRDERRFGPRLVALDPFNFGDYQSSLKVDTLHMLFVLDRSKMERDGASVTAIQKMLSARFNPSIWVGCCDESSASNNSSSMFEVVVQEPTYRLLKSVYEAIAAKYPCTRHPTITQVEIAFDMQPRSAVERGIALCKAAVFMRRSVLPRIDWSNTDMRLEAARVYSPQISQKRNRTLHLGGPDRPERFALTDYPDGTFYLGNDNANTSYRIYWKRYDQVNPETGTKRELPIHDQVARTEVVLRGDAIKDHLGITDLESLRVSDLNGISRVIRFVAPLIPDPTETDSKLLSSLKAKQQILWVRHYLNRGLWEAALEGKLGAKAYPTKGNTAVHPGAQQALKNARKQLLRSFFKGER